MIITYLSNNVIKIKFNLKNVQYTKFLFNFIVKKNYFLTAKRSCHHRLMLVSLEKILGKKKCCNCITIVLIHNMYLKFKKTLKTSFISNYSFFSLHLNFVLDHIKNVFKTLFFSWTNRNIFTSTSSRYWDTCKM